MRVEDAKDAALMTLILAVLDSQGQKGVSGCRVSASTPHQDTNHRSSLPETAASERSCRLHWHNRQLQVTNFLVVQFLSGQGPMDRGISMIPFLVMADSSHFATAESQAWVVELHRRIL